MIVYTCIGRNDDAVVLVEWPEYDSDVSGSNAGDLARRMLRILGEQPSLMAIGERRTWSAQDTGSSSGGGFGGGSAANDEQEQYFNNVFCAAFGYNTLDGTEHYFHVYKRHYVTYICLSDDGNIREQNVNFQYLDRLSREFDEKFPNKERSISNAKEANNSMQKRFTKNIRTAVHYYNTHADEIARDEQIDRLMGEVESLKTILGRNIQLVIAQTEDLDRLVAKSDQMTADTSIFKRRSRMVKQKLQRRMWHYYVGIAVGVALFVYLICALSCGWALDGCRRSSSGGDGGDNAAAAADGNNRQLMLLLRHPRNAWSASIEESDHSQS